MSIGFLLPNPDDAVIWRGPRKNGLIKQFLKGGRGWAARPGYAARRGCTGARDAGGGAMQGGDSGRERWPALAAGSAGLSPAARPAAAACLCLTCLTCCCRWRAPD